MDKVDKKLVAMLSENARTPLKVLAQAVSLSSPAVSARIERLEQRGIITGYSARVNPVKAGFHIKAYIALEITPEQKPTVIPYICGCRNVLECDCVTGPYSLLIKVSFPTAEELDRFIGDLQQFGRTQTQMVFANYLPAREVPVEEGEE